jgi:hypothetical protein
MQRTLPLLPTQQICHETRLHRRPHGTNGPLLAGLTSPANFRNVDFSDIAPTIVLSGRVSLTSQKIVIGAADSYHPVAGWAEFIHAVYFGQAVKKVGMRVSTYSTFVMTQEPFHFAN